MLFRGRISYFTHPPETHTLPTHVSAEIVSEMGKAFDWDELEKGNEEILAGELLDSLLMIWLFISFLVLSRAISCGDDSEIPCKMVLFLSI